MRSYLRTVARLAPALVGSMVGAVILLMIVRGLVPPAVLAQAEGAGDFLQAVATIEAVLLAFVVFVVWQQFEDARREVATEANELADLERVARGLPEPQCRTVRALSLQYAEAVLCSEWPAMACGDMRGMKETWGILTDIWRSLQGCSPQDTSQELLHAEALSRFNDLSDARTSRLTSARRRMPNSLAVLLHIGAFMVVMAATLLPVKSLVLHAIMCAALAAAVSHVLWVIHDLDDAFAGDWQVPRGPFERVLERMRAEQG
jgi:hypothetical protein